MQQSYNWKNYVQKRLKFKLQIKDSSIKVHFEHNLINHLGKILKDDLPLNDYKIEDKQTIHLVKGKSAGSSGT